MATKLTITVNIPDVTRSTDVADRILTAVRVERDRAQQECTVVIPVTYREEAR